MSVLPNWNESQVLRGLMFVVVDVFSVSQEAAKPIVVALYRETKDNTLKGFLYYLLRGFYFKWSVDKLIEKIDWAFFLASANDEGYDPFMDDFLTIKKK